MNKKKEVEKKINLVTKLYEDEGIIYTGNLNEISTLQESNYPTNTLLLDMDVTKAFTKTMNILTWTSPIYFIMKAVQKIISVVAKKEKYTRYERTEKEKILADIETLVKSKSDINDFSSELNKLIGKKGVDNLSKFAENKANVDYSYLNKLINGKLPDNAVISRDYSIKLSLALELDLNETNGLISRAGYIICGNNKRDTIISVCLENRTGVDTTNEILHEADLKIL